MKDYMNIGGRNYRVEANWNATTAFLQAVGRDSIEELSNIRSFKPSELTALIHACICEGERLDGHDEPVPSPLDLGAVLSSRNVGDFLEIYVRQSAPKMEVEEPKKEEREERPA